MAVGYYADRTKAETVVQDLQQAGHSAFAHQVDTRDLVSVRAFLDAAREFGGGLGGIISATGSLFPVGMLTDVGEEDFRRVMDIDVFGTFNILKAGVPALAAGGGGPIVLFLTTAVLRTLALDAMSSVPKTAVASMLRQVAREAGPLNVRVNGIAPGVIHTEMLDDRLARNSAARQLANDCLENTPLGRRGRLEEVAALAAFLTSDAAAYINGQVIAIDGGFSA